jgi:hypothetical protein
MEARVIPFCVVSLLYLWPLIAEAVAGVRKTRAGRPARWEGALNLVLLPFVGITAAVAQPAVAWMPPWYVVVAVALLVDVLGLLAWWAACVIAAPAAESPDDGPPDRNGVDSPHTFDIESKGE